MGVSGLEKGFLVNTHNGFFDDSWKGEPNLLQFWLLGTRTGIKRIEMLNPYLPDTFLGVNHVYEGLNIKASQMSLQNYIL